MTTQWKLMPEGRPHEVGQEATQRTWSACYATQPQRRPGQSRVCRNLARWRLQLLRLGVQRTSCTLDRGFQLVSGSERRYFSRGHVEGCRPRGRDKDKASSTRCVQSRCHVFDAFGCGMGCHPFPWRRRRCAPSRGWRHGCAYRAYVQREITSKP